MELTLAHETPATSGEAPSPTRHDAHGVQVRYYPVDGSVFIDHDYLIKGVAGAIFWKLVREHAQRGRTEFSTRELRLARDELRLPDLQDNLESRLLLLKRRLAARAAPMQIVRTGRGRLRFAVDQPLRLVDATCA